MLLDRCMSADFEKKKTYHTLQIIVDFVPSCQIVSKYPQLPEKLLTMLLDQSKSQVCQMTLIKMVHSHWKYLKTQDNESCNDSQLTSWRQTWIDNLLNIQMRETSESFRVNAGFIQYIKFLFKTDANSLTYILKRADLSLVVRLMIIKAAADENLFASMESGKTSQPDLTTTDCEDRDFWRKMVPRKVMFDAVWSFSSQVGTSFLIVCFNRFFYFIFVL